jgi:hypothetical protein
MGVVFVFSWWFVGWLVGLEKGLFLFLVCFSDRILLTLPGLVSTGDLPASAS